ncbi:MAG: hypothetical protein UY81_C0006G0014 [Candidatus Giovannonibacteria bacterium GW2011_GWA2_53_7]|uniref:Cohesin domain-containing protein n=1 Tax=Candidatus Giovannonibacteria bacterium GW2011_GWA2_53_7 TaxID=1618650 RepID=A0A0G1Y1K9_9BACT|nr:MAG: hypothetical protein UY81_C0006G0014 [Candidatus Giovannonibacteria bacterium GW2011_GWA2_53_7]
MFLSNILSLRSIKVGVLFFFFSFAQVVYATDATLFLSPVTGTFVIGDTFSVQVMVASDGVNLNAVEGKITFDSEMLEIMSATTSDSALTSWAIPPTIDSQKGELSWSGIVPRGITGERLLLFQFEVKGRRAGEAPLRFTTGAAVLAADGNGTNVLTSMNGGVYVITPKEVLPQTSSGGSAFSTSETSGGEVLGAATGTTHITSTTHPDPERWYTERTGIFAWEVPLGVVAVHTGFDNKSTGAPFREYRPAIKEKTIKDIFDGVQYFHLSREYENGETDIEHRRVAVDATPPAGLSATIISRDDATDPTVSFLVAATDTVSGIDHFTFALDDASPVEWHDDGTHRYALSRVSPGQHVLHGVAYDQAGNITSIDENFSVDALPPPEVILSKTTPKEGEQFTLSGKTIPGGTVRLFVARGGEEPSVEEVTSDAHGTFSLASVVRLSPGVYEYWGEVKNVHGAVSSQSVHASVVVSTTLLGLVKRHPMIPAAVVGLFVILAGTIFLVRRARRGIGEKEDEEVEKSLVAMVSRKKVIWVVVGGT